MKKAMLLSFAAAFCALQAHADTTVIDFRVKNKIPTSFSLKGDQLKAILGQLNPPAVVLDQSDPNAQCPDGSQVVMSSKVKAYPGTFSRKGATEMLVTMSIDNCPGSHAGTHPILLLVRDGKVVRVSAEQNSTKVVKLVDIDGDGLMEAITTYEGGGMGEFATDASTLTFKRDLISPIAYVTGNVKVKSCESEEDDPKTYAAMFTADDKGTVAQHNFVADCAKRDGNGRLVYKAYSEGELKLPGDDQ